MPPEERTKCRTPAAGRDGVTRIPTWKYQAVRRAILAAIDAAGPEGLAFKELPGRVKALMDPSELARLGSVGWHCTTVKLNMEVEGEIARLPGTGAQRIVRAI